MLDLFLSYLILSHLVKEIATELNEINFFSSSVLFPIYL